MVGLRLAACNKLSGMATVYPITYAYDTSSVHPQMVRLKPTEKHGGVNGHRFL